MNYKEAKRIDSLCSEAGLDNSDWDEGGGYVPEAVVRVMLNAEKAGAMKVIAHPIVQKFLWFANNVPCISAILSDTNKGCECATCLAKKLQAFVKELEGKE